MYAMINITILYLTSFRIICPRPASRVTDEEPHKDANTTEIAPKDAD